MINEIFQKYKIIPNEIYEKIINSEYIFLIDDNNILDKLFEHLYVPKDLYNKIPKTDFLYNSASFLKKNNYLTNSLENQSKLHITEYTDFTDLYKPLAEDSRYTSNHKGNKNEYDEKSHEFKRLETIDLYELPFDNNQITEIIIHPYSNNNIIIEIKQHFYRVHKPIKFEVPKKIKKIRIQYKRTKYKGFLTLI